MVTANTEQFMEYLGKVITKQLENQLASFRFLSSFCFLGHAGTFAVGGVLKEKKEKGRKKRKKKKGRKKEEEKPSAKP